MLGLNKRFDNGQYSSAGRTPSPLSSSWQWGRRPIRPLAHGNNKQAEWFWRALLSEDDWGVGHICAPIRTVHEWDVEHQVRQVAAAITEIRFLRPLYDLSFGLSFQHKLCPSVSNRQDGAHSVRVETKRPSNFWTPEPRAVNSTAGLQRRHPRSFYDTHETVPPFESGFIAMPS